MNKLVSFSGFAGTRLVMVAVLLLSTAGAGLAQSAPPEPARQQLLNGLQILLWPKPGDANVAVKMRIHSGAAYDLAGKAGMMALLGDVLFPEAETRQYFTDELGGRLDVTTDYDGMTISMSGRAGEFERMIELLRNALVSTPLTPENVAKLREARVQILRDTNATPASIADRAIATRLFGEFPYGRPAAGAAETVSRIDRGDLMLARERFLNADNATLVVAGGVDERRVLRTLRQLLGNWRKSDRLVPATFRQPEPPNEQILIVNHVGAAEAEIRLATRGLARADRDAVAATMLALIGRDRWQTALSSSTKVPVFARHEAHMVPGLFVMGTSVHNADAAKAIAAARTVIKSLITTPPSAAEFERARNELAGDIGKRLSDPGSLIDIWLDMDTFKLKPIADQAVATRNLTPANIQEVAIRLFKDRPLATVVLGNNNEIKQSMSGEKVEILGEPVAKPSTTPQPTAKKP
jgi:predicted Zn-dependent peptidase